VCPSGVLPSCLQSELEAQPPGVPTYLAAAAGPPATSAVRKFCSVCGNASP
jgi:zinc finger HIT domain-containing protein 1